MKLFTTVKIGKETADYGGTYATFCRPVLAGSSPEFEMGFISETPPPRGGHFPNPQFLRTPVSVSRQALESRLWGENEGKLNSVNRSHEQTVLRYSRGFCFRGWDWMIHAYVE